jgi:hypothetical protein
MKEVANNVPEKGDKFDNAGSINGVEKSSLATTHRRCNNSVGKNNDNLLKDGSKVESGYGTDKVNYKNFKKRWLVFLVA